MTRPSSLAPVLSLALFTCFLFQASAYAGKKLVNQRGTIKKLGNVGFVIIPENQQTRYAPTKLAKEFQQDQLTVVFSGEVGAIPPNVRLAGTPLKLTAITKAAGKAAAGVREITGLSPASPNAGRGTANKPTVVQDKAAVAKAFSDKATQQAVMKQVNFDKEILLVFRWAGSGQDRIAATSQKTKDGLTVTFGYSRGLTRDLRRHFKVFAVAKDAKWKVENKGFARPGRPAPRKLPGARTSLPDTPAGLTRSRIRLR